MVFVFIMTIAFALVAIGVLVYAQSSSLLIYDEIKHTKAYYAAEAGLQRGIYEASVLGLIGARPDFSVPSQGINISYLITVNVDGTKTVTSNVDQVSSIQP